MADTSFSYERTAVEAGDDEEEDLWSSMLVNVASSKRMPTKSILVLGGSTEEQRDFVETLGQSSKKRVEKKPPLANEFALGYTYIDVLDADHEDIITRLGIYMLSTPTPSFAPLLRPLLTPQTLPNTLLVILLDWQTPWDWMRQIRRWIRLLRDIFFDLDDEAKASLEEVMKAWESRPRGTEAGAVQQGMADIVLPLGPGEFDEPIGLPLCVVCQNADRIELLERERGWKEEEFDFVLQFLRTILLKRTALSRNGRISFNIIRWCIVDIYQYNLANIVATSNSQYACNTLNIKERDKVLVPPSWDSWGKIRVLRDFDVEGVGSGWSVDIQTSETPFEIEGDVEGGAVEVYEDVIKDTRPSNAVTGIRSKNALEFPSVDTQEFLASQMEVLEAKKEEERQAATASGGRSTMGMGLGTMEGDSKVRDHVGPVQFNVGGIHVDADDMLRRLKDRDSTPVPDAQNAGSNSTSNLGTPNPTSPGGTVDGKSQNEVLAQFFSSLMKKGTKANATNAKAGSGTGPGSSGSNATTGT